MSWLPSFKSQSSAVAFRGFLIQGLWSAQQGCIAIRELLDSMSGRVLCCFFPLASRKSRITLSHENRWKLSVLVLFESILFPSRCSGGTAPLVICSDCYDNANIYSRTREYCPYTYITEEDPLDQTLPNLMVQMPKETYPAHTQHETSALDNVFGDRDMSVFLTSHDRISEKKIPSQQINGECVLFPPDILYFLVLLTFLVLPFIVGSLLILQTPQCVQ